MTPLQMCNKAFEKVKNMYDFPCLYCQLKFRCIPKATQNILKTQVGYVTRMGFLENSTYFCEDIFDFILKLYYPT